MACRHTEQRMKRKIERGEGKVNVEEKAMQRGESADTTWSIGKEGVLPRPIPLAAVQNHVAIFREYMLGDGGKSPAAKFHFLRRIIILRSLWSQRRKATK